MSASVRPGVEPNLATYGEELIRQALLRTNCHALGQVQAFDPVHQSASITLGYKRQMADGSLRDYPVLVECPVLFSGGGGASGGRLTFAVAKGDDCLVLFNDRNMDNWIVSGQVARPDTTRLHSFSDALALVGLRPFCRALSAFFTDGAELAWGQAAVQLTDKVKIKNAATDLKTLLNGLIDLVAAATVSGAPLSNAAAITAYKAQIAGLLK